MVVMLVVAEKTKETPAPPTSPSRTLALVSSRIDVVLRVIPDVAVPVQALRVIRRLHERVGTDKPADLGIVIPPAVVIEPRFRI
jgi:hypothetical protein